MERGCFIGIDQGSSSTKALAVATDGAVLFRAKRELPPPLRDGPRVEQDPGEVLGSVCDVLDEIVRQAKDAGIPVFGAGLSCQRSSCLVWDGPSGRPLSPVLSWRDTRGASFVDSLAEQADRIFAATGLPLTPYYSASKLRWLREHVPSAREGTARFGTLSSFLCRRLTAVEHDVIDHTNAARTQLMDVRTCAWDPQLIDLFDLGGAGLPEIVPTAFRFGVIDTPAGPVPLLASIGDQQSAMLGLGVTEAGEGGINYGTGGFLMVNTGTELRPAAGLMASVHYSRESERRYLLEGSVNAVGDALEWLRSRFNLFGAYREVDGLCREATGDVVVFLGLNGTGAPHWERDVPTALQGLTGGSGPADIVRAAVEGFAFFLKDIADAAAAAGVRPSSLVVSGGLSSIGYLVRTQADILGMDLTVASFPESSARGAAYLAGMQYGTWNAADVRSMAGGGRAVAARPNPSLLRRYGRWKDLHRMVRGFGRP